MLVLAEIHLALKLEGQALSCLMSEGLATASGREGVLSIEPYSSYCALSTQYERAEIENTRTELPLKQAG